MSDAELVSVLQARFDRELRAAVRPGARVALVGFPAHENVGDSAIWLGTTSALDRLGITLVYACDWRTYREQELRSALRSGDTILVSGGGNFGDLWPGEQELREKVLADFPEQPTVQLPQSIRFDREENLARTRRLLEAHHDVVLVVRDVQSLELARGEFDVPVQLWPDACFGLGPLPRPHLVDHDAAVIKRHDKESLYDALPPLPFSAVTGDWLRPLPGEDAGALDGARHAHQVASDALLEEEPRSPAVLNAWRRTLDPLAAARLRRGCSFLSRGSVVLTDRLHAHLLSMLLGIPHVVLDNSYGKIRSAYDTWTKSSSLAVWAEAMPTAVAAVERLLQARDAAASPRGL